MFKLLSLFFLTVVLFANDAEYITSANGLTPIKSKNIKLTKEVLNITKLKDGYFRVDIKYTLLNSSKDKETLIGFEAPQPIGEDNLYNSFFYKEYDISKKQEAELKAIKLSNKPKKDSGIEDFSVKVNGKPLEYKVVTVLDLKDKKGSTPYVGYLYYFKTKLKSGVNKIEQSYKCMTSASVVSRYEFEYILATAKEWQGGIIEDLEINFKMGEFETFQMQPTFFNSLNNWIVKNGKVIFKKSALTQERVAKFYLKDGKATFKAKNFIPKNGINLLSLHYYKIPDKSQIFNYKKDKLPFSIYYTKESIATNSYTIFAKDATSLKILKNLPYARRGYNFKTKVIANYYKAMPWYKVDKKYKANYNKLTKNEQKWLNSIEKFKLKILRNTPFAKRGYIFTDERLNIFFSTFNWYKPNKDYNANLRDLSTKELMFIKDIKTKKRVKDREFFKLLEKALSI